MLHKTAKTVHEYVVAHNMYAHFFSVARPNCWMSTLSPAEALKADYGINTVDELLDWLDECSKPSLADQIYLYHEQWYEIQKEQERLDAIEDAKLIEKYTRTTELKQNPFADLYNMVTKKQ